MKILSLLFITIFLSKGCDAQKKQDMETAVVEYVANTRGFYRKVTIQNQMVSVSKARNGDDKPLSTKISDGDWAALVAAFQEVDLNGIPELKSPTQKRFYDGAAIATLTITYKGKKYESAPFDHGNPPEAIEKFVEKVTSFIKKEP